MSVLRPSLGGCEDKMNLACMIQCVECAVWRESCDGVLRKPKCRAVPLNRTREGTELKYYAIALKNCRWFLVGMRVGRLRRMD